MGWGRTLLLGDIGTQMNLDDLQREISVLHDRLQDNRGADPSEDLAIQQLTDENHKLKLCIGTLSRLLVAKNVLTREELGSISDFIDDAAAGS